MVEPNSVTIGNSSYSLSERAKQYFNPATQSTYQHTKSVIIINEPHDSFDGQVNLYKGLEVFFRENPSLIRKTIFLAEGTQSGEPISVQPLTKESSNPNEELIREVLSSFLITGYMAYEWKHQHSIPIIGTEDKGLYDLSRQFASVCMKDKGIVFKTLKYKDGTDFPVPLGWAWMFAIAARNKAIAKTLIEKTSLYENPILFVGRGHLKKTDDDIFNLLKDY